MIPSRPHFRFYSHRPGQVSGRESTVLAERRIELPLADWFRLYDKQRCLHQSCFNLQHGLARSMRFQPTFEYAFHEGVFGHLLKETLRSCGAARSATTSRLFPFHQRMSVVNSGRLKPVGARFPRW